MMDTHELTVDAGVGWPGSARLQTILVVDDEESYQDALHAGLSREGYQVRVTSTGADALKTFAHELPDLVLLDILLPDISGVEVCRRMLGVAPVPIIMVSALSAEENIVDGLALGAVDYVTKPYRLRELVARIHAVLRRTEPPRRVGPKVDAERRTGNLVAGPVRVELSSRVVTRSGQRIHLSRREFDLLAFLMSPADYVRTRDELIDAVWSKRDLSDSRTLDTHVRRLRMKLEKDPGDPQLLVTVRGVGFRFMVDGVERKARFEATV
jgi:two-component system, OmpR family, response regulator RegX3